MARRSAAYHNPWSSVVTYISSRFTGLIVQEPTALRSVEIRVHDTPRLVVKYRPPSPAEAPHSPQTPAYQVACAGSYGSTVRSFV